MLKLLCCCCCRSWLCTCTQSSYTIHWAVRIYTILFLVRFVCVALIRLLLLLLLLRLYRLTGSAVPARSFIIHSPFVPCIDYIYRCPILLFLASSLLILVFFFGGVFLSCVSFVMIACWPIGYCAILPLLGCVPRTDHPVTKHTDHTSTTGTTSWLFEKRHSDKY